MIIKELPEDFKVYEIIDIPVKEDGNQTYFWMTKTNWTTDSAIGMVAKKLGISHKRLKFAGTKDKHAVTRQAVSAFKVDPEWVKRIEISDIELEVIGKGDDPISIGTLYGNRFEIVIRDLSEEEVITIKKNSETVSTEGFPNYFGGQRFGKGSTHIIGKDIIKGDLEGAVKTILTFEGDREFEDKKEFRRSVIERWGEWDSFEEFPRGLSFERNIINYLKNNPTDFGGALRQVPKHVRKLYVHAYQSYLWNTSLEKLKGTDLPEELPIPGYKSILEDNDFTKSLKELLGEDEISLEDLRCPRMPELALEGDIRKAIVIPENLEIVETGKDEIHGNNKVKVAFSLPKGTYATVLVDCLLKPVL